jgi:hypothetical protein
MDQFYEKIEAYLLGELPESELKDFENALKADPALAKSVAQHRAIMQRLEGLRIRNKVKSAILPRRATTVPIYANRSFWALAASVILLVGAIWFFNLPAEKTSNWVEHQPPVDSIQTPPPVPNETVSPQSTESQAITPPEEEKNRQELIALAREFHDQPTQSFVRDASNQQGNPASKTPLQLAAEAFDQKNYRLSAEILKADDRVQQDETARFLRANARFELGQFVGAARDFEVLQTGFQFKYEARWNYLLCQIALGKINAAKALLAEMVAKEDFPFRAKALKLKDKLKGI